MAPEPFAVAWDESAVAAVRDRARSWRPPPAPEGAGWRYGADPDFMRGLCAYWADGYDWRGAVAELNAWPQFRAEMDGFPLHFVHVVGEARGRRPLLLTHGWPGSHYEFWQAIGPLAYPSRHGGQASDAFDLVIPSLPGFGFSGRPTGLLDQRRTAALFDRLMQALGYTRYLAQGGDWGANVTARLALQYPERVAAIHLNMLFPPPSGPPLGAEEEASAAEDRRIEFALGGYGHLQASKPQSLVYAMADNPVAQAAWIVERFHDWADLRTRPFEAVFPRDRLLTNVLIYVMTGAFPTSVWYYAAAAEASTRLLAPGERVEVPTAFASLADPRRSRPLRSVAERGYAVSRWTEFPRGGHFAAMEVPELYVEDLRGWGREAWPL